MSEKIIESLWRNINNKFSFQNNEKTANFWKLQLSWENYKEPFAAIAMAF